MLDQRIIVGIGNIYASEILYRSNINPETPSADLKPEALDKIIRNTRKVLEEAIEAGGSTLRDFKNAQGLDGKFQHSFSVYDRKGMACLTPHCSGRIERITQQGRSTYLCPICQPL